MQRRDLLDILTGLPPFFLRLKIVAVVLIISGPVAVAQTPDFQQLFNHQGVVMLLIDPVSGQIVDANPAAVDFYGYKSEALRAMRIQQINTLSAEQVAEERALAEHEGRNYFIFRHALASGDIRTVEVYSHPFEFDNRRLLLSIIHDITPGRNLEQGMWHYQQRLEEMVGIRTAEATARDRVIIVVLLGALIVVAAIMLALLITIRRRKRVETALQVRSQELAYRQALFSALFEQSGFLAGILDQRGRMLEVNQRALQFIDQPTEALLGRDFLDTPWWQERDRTRLRKALMRAANGQADCFEAVHPLSGGEGVTVLFHALPVQVENTVYISVISVDITERKQAEEALRQRTLELARSNAELEQFAYVVSHDLRQPLRMISSYLKLLEGKLTDKLDQDTRIMLNYAVDGAVRMDQMLLSLLEYSRVGRSGEPLAEIDCRVVVDEALRFLAADIREAQAQVVIEGHWPVICASRDELTRLWQNLIGNALKYRNADIPCRVVISAGIRESELQFCVADNGIGIDPKQFDRAFKVFQRLHAADKYQGTGIGLAIARKIVERHGGRIWVVSEGADSGSRFCFTLQTAGTHHHNELTGSAVGKIDM